MEKALKLKKYQEDGIDLIVNRYKDVLLADHPGAGKTCQAIIAADRLSANRILVICPASLRENWKREFEKWSDKERQVTVVYDSKDASKLYHNTVYTLGVVIVSYDLITRISLGNSEHCDVLILDEAHYLKSSKSKRTKRILKEVWAKAKKRIAITGTPMPNGRAIEAYPLFSKLCPEHFGSWKSFADRFCVREVTPWATLFTKSKNLPLLGSMAREHFMIRRDREETIGQLPPLVRMEVPLSCHLYVTDDFNNPHDIHEAMDSLDDGTITPHIATLRRMIGLRKIAAAAEYIHELLLDSAKQVVVFCHHGQVIDELSSHLEWRTITHSVIKGETPMIVRQAAVDGFQAGRHKVFLASLLAANTGITLTAAHDVVFVEADWVPANNEQAEGRCFRLGQTEITRSHYLVIPNTLDDLMTKAILKKQRDITKVMGDLENDKGDKNVRIRKIEKCYEPSDDDPKRAA